MFLFFCFLNDLVSLSHRDDMCTLSRIFVFVLGIISILVTVLARFMDEAHCSSGTTTEACGAFKYTLQVEDRWN